jgi:hypothetical protein
MLILVTMGGTGIWTVILSGIEIPGNSSSRSISQIPALTSQPLPSVQWIRIRVAVLLMHEQTSVSRLSFRQLIVHSGGIQFRFHRKIRIQQQQVIRQSEVMASPCNLRAIMHLID